MKGIELTESIEKGIVGATWSIRFQTIAIVIGLVAVWYLAKLSIIFAEWLFKGAEADAKSDTDFDVDQAFSKRGIIGQERIKSELKVWYVHAQNQRARDPKGPVPSKVILLKGAPGTGKTSIASVLAEMLHSAGITKQNKLIVKKASDIIVPFVGQTARNMVDAVEEAKGGVLFIDEAYEFIEDIDKPGKSDEGSKALSALLEPMLTPGNIIIMAGYKTDMERLKEKANPGIVSRITHEFELLPYRRDQLAEMLCNSARRAKVALGSDKKCESEVLRAFEGLTEEDISRGGNARLVDNIFQRAMELHDSKIGARGADDPELYNLQADDVRQAVAAFQAPPAAFPKRRKPRDIY